ncbi:unnamed protein product [Mesocestoides corti]|uniref:Uncharacterized protein n=1 Tax=Mesocestoides corti TaxID=53468 RepID=A0A3P6GPR4_MESCO|nr:unnamed protein product [Mesocestoides corti]
MASCGEDKSVCLWVLEGSTWKFACSSTESHTRTVRHVSWSPSDNYLATASFDSAVVIWRIVTSEGAVDLQSIAILEGHANEVKCVAWAVSGHLLATCGRDKSVWIWEFDDEEDFQCVSVLQPHNADVKSVFWHPIKEVQQAMTTQSICIKRSWMIGQFHPKDVFSILLLLYLAGHDSTVWKAEFSPTGELLASVSEDKSVKLWHELPNNDSLHWVCFKTLADCHAAPVSPCGQYLATCGGDNCVFIFRVKLASGNFLDAPSTGNVVVWQNLPKAHDSDVNSVTWFPKVCNKSETSHKAAYLLATAGDDRLVNLWTVPLDPDCIDCFVHSQTTVDEFDVD